MTVQLIEKKVAVIDQAGETAIKSTQFIPQSFMDEIKSIRDNSISTPMGEMHLAAVIPTATIDRWYSEGFDYMREPIAKVLDRLRKEHLDGFIATNRRI